jgi:hypothetical protein
MNFGSLKIQSKIFATIRKLTTATIEGHLVKLIQSKKSMQDILPSDKITELSEVQTLQRRIAKRYERAVWRQIHMGQKNVKDNSTTFFVTVWR